MDYEMLFDYEPIREDEFNDFSREDLYEHILDLQERLTLIYDLVHSLSDEIDEKEALLNEIHNLTNI